MSRESDRREDSDSASSEDERMDRARRIREMREGQRDAAEAETGADAETTDSDSESETADSEPNAEDAGESDAAPAAATDADPRESASEGGDSGTGAPSSEDAETDDAPSAEAMAVAERAAAAAADLSEAEDAAALARQAAADATDGSDASAPVMQGATGVELPDQAAIEEAMDGAVAAGEDEVPTTAAPGVEAAESTTAEERTRVLEFALGDATYCIDIEYVEEIVEREAITRVPNTPAYVTGVVDLRGQITTILDPKTLLDVDQTGPEGIIVVFDPDALDDQGAIGWLVDEVRQVDPILESEVNDPPVDDEYVNGVVDRDDEFVIWIAPDVALRSALDGD